MSGMSGPLSESTFKDAVRTYIELYDELGKSSKTLREMKKKKDELGDAILAFMRNNKIDEFQIGDGKLMRKNTKRTEALKKEYIINSLKAALGDEGKVEAMMVQMNSHRNITECESLRRTRQGKSTAD
jgi:hypothetical protein